MFPHCCILGCKCMIGSAIGANVLDGIETAISCEDCKQFDFCLFTEPN